MFTKQEAEILGAFLGRVQLQGTEVQAFNHIVQKIGQMTETQEPTTEEVPEVSEES